MKVRATKDGVYGGYYRVEGEVFEIDDTPYELKDSSGEPLLDLDDNGKPIPVLVNGKPKIGPKGKPVYRIQTGVWFTKEWMEKVDDGLEVTNDYPPFKIPATYQEKKKGSGPAMAIPTPHPVSGTVI